MIMIMNSLVRADAKTWNLTAELEMLLPTAKC